MAKLSKKKVLAIYRFLKKGGTTRAAAKKFGIGKSTATDIGSGHIRRSVTKHCRLSPSVAKPKKGVVNYGRRKDHRGRKINCLGLRAPVALVDETARRLVEDPPFREEWMEWWLARGREVIAGDEGVWQSLMNVTMWDCFRSNVAGHERSTKIRELLCKKRIDVGAGQVLEWRVNYPGKTDVKPQ